MVCCGPQEQEPRWRRHFEERWGEPSLVVRRAAELAGGWRRLYAAKHEVEREAIPWMRPTLHELNAAVENIAIRGWSQLCGSKADRGPCHAPCSLLFLVDGSGSVTEGAPQIAPMARALRRCPRGQLRPPWACQRLLGPDQGRAAEG